MTKTARLAFLSWLVLAGSVGSPTPCFATTPVNITPEVETKRATVRLSDLFVGVPAEIDRDIAQVPPLCKSAVYNQIVLSKLASMYRLEWQPQNGELDHVVVTSVCTRISGEMIRTALTDKIKAELKAKDRNLEVALDDHTLEIDLPAGEKPEFKLENFSYDPIDKHFRSDLVTETQRGRRILPVTGHVAIKRTIPVLAHRLEGHSVIGMIDLDWIQIPEERLTDDIVTESSQLIGRELRRDLGEGEMFRSRDVIPPRLVQRGALVTMRIKTRFITITAQGKAQQDGAEGETVRLTNTQSNRTVEGVVTGPGMVDIHTAQEIALAE